MIAPSNFPHGIPEIGPAKSFRLLAPYLYQAHE